MKYSIKQFQLSLIEEKDSRNSLRSKVVKPRHRYSSTCYVVNEVRKDSELSFKFTIKSLMPLEKTLVMTHKKNSSFNSTPIYEDQADKSLSKIRKIVVNSVFENVPLKISRRYRPASAMVSKIEMPIRGEGIRHSRAVSSMKN